MKKLSLAVVVLAALAFVAYTRNESPNLPGSSGPAAVTDDAVLKNAFNQRLSNIQVEGRGTVVKVLADDNSGGRHQRFIVRLKNGQTLLIAHNIDLAARIPSLAEGDEVAFSGEYEWSSKGGVVHWTHRDPDGRHQAGWIKHKGRSFQ